MHQMLRSAALALALASVAWSTVASAKPRDCRQGAIEKLSAASPGGYSIYEKIKDKKFFTNWISCGEPQLGLPTAVHESVHYISGETDTFPLVGGGEMKRPQEVSRFYKPNRIAAKFKSNIFVSTYLKLGSASSATDFLYLLDELNAYTHDLASQIDLTKAGVNRTLENRDGLSALMAFMALYIQNAEESEPATWTGLRKPEIAKVVSTIWSKAESTMISSCRVPDNGYDDKSFLKQVCQAKVQSSLEKVLGRAPVCPTECLQVRVSQRAD